MALADSAANAATRFASLSIVRQMGILLGLAASVAIGVSVVLWSRDPDYMPLYSQLSPRDSAEVVDYLQQNAIQFKINENQGTVLVAANEIQKARMKLAAEGLPRGHNTASELFANSNAFNTSQFMENARYKQALESELARTISQFHDIKSARIHLAIPRESAFVRDNREPSASVFIDVYPGIDLNKQTIASIINLVASSIPSLTANRVTVVDQNGQLLSEGAGQTLFSNTERFLDYRQTLEQQYTQKVQDILTPLIGFGRVKVKVAADVDFTSYEQTQEIFNPEQSVLRSEQTMEEKRKVGSGAAGVPGSLSNSPATAASLKNQQNKGSMQQIGTTQTTIDDESDFQRQSTKNFELDKTISHTKNQPGTIKRLTVAVLVDDRPVMDEKTKKMAMKPLTKAEIEQIKILVADAIGINPQRGDSLNVINSHFVKPEPIAPIPALKFWQTPAFWSIIKQVVGALFVLILVFGVLKPFFKSLASGHRPGRGGGNVTGEGEENQEGGTVIVGNDYDSQLSLMRQVADKEPKKVAQVVKTWVDRG